jgi:Mrp family chromosome partitioning ATPase
MDPELHISIVELGMVKGIEFEGKTLNLTIALTVSGCPLRAQIEQDIDQALRPMEGFDHIHLAFAAMEPEELQALRQRLGGQRARQINPQPGAPQHHSPGPADAGGINRLPKKVPHIIAVTSGKGGVGKSSVTAMLATSLQRLGKKVGVLDADITGPSIARIFGAHDKPEVQDEQVLIPVGTKSGVKILSMNLLIDDEDAPVIWRGPLVNGAIRQLYSDAAWEGLDFLLLDLPPGTSDANLTVFQSIPVDGVVIVTSPQDLVRMIVAKSVAMCKQLRVPIFGLVENLAWISCPGCNRVILPFGPTRGEGVAKDFGVPYLGSLPIDAALAQACDAGQIDLYESKPFAQVAQKVLEASVKA